MSVYRTVSDIQRQKWRDLETGVEVVQGY